MVQLNMVIKHLSYSSINTFNRCPKAFQLSRELNAQPLPAVYFALGTAVHSITESIDLEKLSTQPVQEGERRYTGDDFREVFFSEIEEGLIQEPDFDVWLHAGSEGSVASAEQALVTGPHSIKNWQNFTEDTFKVTDVELEVTCRLPGMYLKTKGFVDRLGEHIEHGRMIIDVKTGKTKPKDKGKQLKDYAALLTASTGEVITKGAYFMAQEGKMSKVIDLSDSTPETLGAENKAKLREINASDYAPVREFTCKFCDQQLNCYAFSGNTPRTKYYDPAHPEYDMTREIPF